MADPTQESAPPGNDEESDVEIEGIDMQDDDDDAVDDGDDAQDVGTTDATEEDKEDQIKVDEHELEELEEARKERMELMAKELASKQQQQQSSGVSKFDYLIGQSEVFAHFLAGSVATTEKHKKKGSRGKSNRLTEAEEDAQLLATATSSRRTTYLKQQPSILAKHCQMHPYQLEGLNWMIKLHDHGINGILADEMGLGKTLQTISLLAYLREGRGVKGPHIVIVPKSVVGNWIKEFKKWCPSIRAVRMGGTKEERKRAVSEDLKPKEDGKYGFDALVCSYEGVLKEKSALAKIPWRYLIIDEAHRIKNENSSLSKAVRLLSTGFRLLITGTPLQNNLHELWALLNFLLPEIFGDSEQFDEWFSMSGKEGQENVIRKLHTVLRPFMLRRVKKDVACALPPKKETKLFIGLTEMQQDWYKRVLRKDAHELNALGGPSQARLMNVLMHLRKVCNHPYLFDGAEKGPPFSDGPHLWENSGKMQLLHKLLPKLKSNGSRVLIFCQMTRLLDILEDYLRLVGYEYCRIDGSTDGETRDSQMEEFNAPGSSKFCFLLSTRAGGLGINLATADIVILYDSDWNPQVDLQAMDRAHRIGQTKPVQVFRFISEGTVEEKIIERADKKLFLDAAVIQQGRLAEQNSKLSKDELMQMVKFGADQIISGKKGTYTDEDIDALIAKGEKRTEALNAKFENAKHNLASFTLSGDMESSTKDTFDFGGENYRDKGKGDSVFINMGTRERKRAVYDVNEYYREAMGTGDSSGLKAHAADVKARKKRKGPHMQDFQLYDRERLDVIAARERELAQMKENHLALIAELRKKITTSPPSDVGQLIEEVGEMEGMLDQFVLTPPEQEEKDQLLSEGFADWSRKDFKSFCSALEKHGRYAILKIIEDVMQETGKAENDIKRYYVAFWLHYRRIPDWNKIIDKIEKGERKTLRLREIKDIIHEKIERHLESVYSKMYPGLRKGTVPRAVLEQYSPWDLLMYSWSTMQFKYGHTPKGWTYRQEEDAFLLTMMHRHGYGAARRIQLEIRRAWQFRFNWFFKSRSPHEIQKRCDVVIKLVEKELEELHEKEEKEKEMQQMDVSQPSGEEANPFINKLTDRVCSLSGEKQLGDEKADGNESAHYGDRQTEDKDDMKSKAQKLEAEHMHVQNLEAEHTQVDIVVQPASESTKVDTVVQSASESMQVDTVGQPASESTKVDTVVQPASESMQVDTVVQPASESTKVDTVVQPASENMQVNTVVQPASESIKVDTVVQPASASMKVGTVVQSSSESMQVDNLVLSSSESMQVDTVVQPSSESMQLDTVVQPLSESIQVNTVVQPSSESKQVETVVQHTSDSMHVETDVPLPSSG